MATSSYLNRTTPGVYITEIPAFGSSIVGVATAVPIFIGYTEFAGDPTTGDALYNSPVALTSINDFATYFGGPALRRYAVSVAAPAPKPSGGGSSGSVPSPAPDFTAYYTPNAGSGGASNYALQGFNLDPLPGQPQFSLYWQMLMFFANGGGNCYVVSVGSYWSNQRPTNAPANTAGWLPAGLSATELIAGITAAGNAVGPTMTVVPEACQLSEDDYGTVIQSMMQQAGTLQDRVAILDLPGCLSANTYDLVQGCQTALWNQTGPQIASASYAAAYAPALSASIVTTNNILYTNLVAGNPADNSLVNNILTAQANQLYGQSSAQLASIQSAIAVAFPLTTSNDNSNDTNFSDNGTAYPKLQPGQTLLQWQTSLDTLLLNALPIFKQIEQQIADQMNVMAPSGAMAGIWTKSDAQNGVWTAPANIAVAAVDAPLYNMNDTQQGSFNVPTNGQAIDVIRSLLNRGTVVWGARTLDGNSNDYCYIQVRRTLIYIEQSIKLALRAYVFAPNDATTWSTVVAAVSSFLSGLWQSGGLIGATPSDAFTVTCGLGSTMTGQDVLDGYMIVAIQLSLVHPAEYVELTITQKMGS